MNRLAACFVALLFVISCGGGVVSSTTNSEPVPAPAEAANSTTAAPATTTEATLAVTTTTSSSVTTSTTTKPIPATTAVPSSEVSTIPGVPEWILALVLDDVSATQGVAAPNIEVVSGEEVVWRDGSLGCPKPNMLYTQALVPGYLVLVRVDGTLVAYHFSEGGNFKICRGGAVLTPPEA